MSLPALHHLDDYWSCVEKGNDFCTSVGALSSTSPDNPVWQQILVARNDDMLLDKSLLHRGICIPKEYSGNLNIQKQFLETYMNDEISHLNLTSNIIQFECLQSPKLRIYDYIILMAVLLYLSLVIAASVYDKWIVKRKNGANVLRHFSIYHNWNDVVHAKTGKDYERLKSMQGIRFIQIFINVIAHSILGSVFVFINDPSMLERKLHNIFYKILFTIVPFIIQSFFLMSSWLCTLQIYNIHEANGKFTTRDLMILIVNRYFRLLPCMAFICILMTTEWVTLLGSSPHLFLGITRFKEACENNMLPTLLFINNYYFVKDMCNPVTWYTSADFQFYVLTAIIVYLILKFQWNYVKVIIIGSVLTCLLYGLITYAKNLDLVFRVRVREFELVRFLTSLSFKDSYTATHTSLTTPFIGVLFGIIYFKTRHRTDLHKNKILVALWYILFYGLSMCVLFLSRRNYGPVTTAILGPLLKPMYAFSMGVAILGMSHNIGGITKKILECRIFEVMGNFCYGAYITHIAFSFTKGMTSFTLYEISRLETDQVIDWICSILSGILLSLALEQPASVLQKNLLPQVKKKSKAANESAKSTLKGVSTTGKDKAM